MNNEHWSDEQHEQYEYLCEGELGELAPPQQVGFHLDYLRDHLRNARAGLLDVDELLNTIDTTHGIAKEHHDCQVCILLDDMASEIYTTTLAEYEGPLREVVESRFFGN